MFKGVGGVQSQASLGLEVPHCPSPAGWPGDNGRSFSERPFRGYTNPCKVSRRLSWSSACDVPHCSLHVAHTQAMTLPVLTRTSCGDPALRGLKDKGRKTCERVCEGLVTELEGDQSGTDSWARADDKGRLPRLPRPSLVSPQGAGDWGRGWGSQAGGKQSWAHWGRRGLPG